MVQCSASWIISWISNSGFYLINSPPKHSIFVCELYDSLIFKFSRSFFSQCRLPSADDVTDLVLLTEAVVDVLLDGVVTEDGEAGQDDAPAADVQVESLEELRDGGGSVKADHVVGAVEHVDGHGVGEGVMVRVLQEDRENFHP